MKTVKQLCFLILSQILYFGLAGSMLFGQGTDSDMSRTVFPQGTTRPCTPPDGNCPDLDGINTSTINCDTDYGLSEDILITPAQNSFLLNELEIIVTKPNGQAALISPVKAWVYHPDNQGYEQLSLPTVITNNYYKEDGKVLLSIHYGMKFCTYSPSTPTGGESSGSEPQELVQNGDYQFILNIHGKYKYEGSSTSFIMGEMEDASTSDDPIFPTPESYPTEPNPADYVVPFSLSNTQIIEASEAGTCLPPYDPSASIPFGPLLPEPGKNKTAGLGHQSWIDTHLYPNPASGLAVLEINLLEQEEIRFQILDLSGRVLMNQENLRFEKGKHKIKLDLTPFPSGVYFIHLQTHKKSETAKFLKIE